MAREEVHNYLRMIVLLAGIVFAGGGYAMKVSSNSSAIIKVEEKADANMEAIHKVELNAKDTQALAAKAAEAMVSIDSKFSDIQTKLNEQAVIQGINSTKLESLTKD